MFLHSSDQSSALLPGHAIGFIPSVFSPLEQEGLALWLQNADPAKRQALMRVRAEGRALRLAFTEAIAKIQSLYQFSQPKLEQMAREANGQVVDTVNGQFLVFKPASSNLPDRLDQVLQSNRSLYEAALQNFSEHELVALAGNPFVKMAVPQEFDIFAGFTGKEKQATQAINSIIVYPDEGTVYALRVRNLDLGKQYQEYLQSTFKGDRLLSLKCAAAVNVLREELLIAEIKGQVTADAQRAITLFLDRAAQGDQRYDYLTDSNPQKSTAFNGCRIWSLRLLEDVPLSEVLLFCAEQTQSACIAFLPGHAQPLKVYPTRAAFFADLVHQLDATAFANYFLRFVPRSARPAALQAMRANEDAQRLDLLNLRAVPLDKGLNWHWYEQMRQRISKDAEFLAVPTETVMGRKNFVRISDFVETTRTHLMLAAGIGFEGREENEGQVACDYVLPLNWVILPDGHYVRWASNLSGHALPTGLELDPANAQGVTQSSLGRSIRINGRNFLIQHDAQLGKERLDIVGDQNAYRPILEHNGAGSWHHSLERPERWGRLSLLRRLGAWLDDLDDDTLLLAGRLAGVSNDRLHRVYSEDERPPALLRWSIEQLRLIAKTESIMRLIKDGRPVPSEYEVPLLTEFHQQYGAAESHNRPRRSPQTGEEYCAADCGAPPAVLFLEWYDRLFRVIFTRITIRDLPPAGQVASEAQIGELRQHFPGLPVLLLEELIEASSPTMLSTLGRGMPDPDLFERSQRAWNAFRLTRALMGFRSPAGAHTDTHRLAFVLLARLPGWQADLNLALYGQSSWSFPLARHRPVAEAPSWGLSAGHLGWTITRMDMSDLLHERRQTDFYHALLDLIGEPQRRRLGLGLNEGERLRNLLSEQAYAAPGDARVLLGIEQPPITLHPDGVGRRLRAMGGTGGHFERESPQQRLQLLFPRGSVEHVGRIEQALLRQGTPLTQALDALEDERLRLDGAMRGWIGQGAASGWRTRNRSEMAARLLGALDPTLRRLELHNAHLEDLPSLPVDFTAIEVLVLDLPDVGELSGGFISSFPNLRELRLVMRIGQLPTAVIDLPQLRVFALSGARMWPQALGPLGQIASLRELHIGNLTYPAPRPGMSAIEARTWSVDEMTAITGNNRLERLSIESCRAVFADGVFGVLAQLPNLVDLDLSRNSITLEEENISALVHVRELDLSSNPLYEDANVTPLRALRCLNLSYTRSGWPIGLEQLPHIERANLAPMDLTTVPVNAGLVPGLSLSVAGLQTIDRERVLREMSSIGNERGADHDPVRLSRADVGAWTSSESEDEEAEEDGLAASLFEGMAVEDRRLADQLEAQDSPGSRAFFGLMRRTLARATDERQAEVLEQIQAIVLRMFIEQTREEFYQVALDEGCSDSDAQRFADLQGLAEADRIAATALEGERRAELIELGLSLWRLRYLRESVLKHYRDWLSERRRAGVRVTDDYAEIELYIRIALTQRLGLRHQPTVQRYAELVEWMTPAMADQVEREVLAAQQEYFPRALVDQPFWQNHISAEECAPWSFRVEEVLQDMRVGEEVPQDLEEPARTHLLQLLRQARERIASQAGVTVNPGPLQLDDENHRLQAYNVLPAMIDRARLEYTRQVLTDFFASRAPQSPQPGPSGTQRRT
ncbi:dermonecrotic toxin domain-containing protein [Pseudomonas sp. Irchel 3F5]|uniref:dermonecrotic toxin domain-containing protein n=1 Tax=Pseudomonas sp. Irchel 3F5 TaxID=2009002 RepID=UPI000BA42115|nr:DUF6543 domain-containing protein [Pseudomonas sp. Irchel 3F5]